MDFIKKFAKEISVFGVVIIIFLALFIYRQMTFKDYTTIDQKDLTEMVTDKEDFVVVAGDPTDNTMIGFQDIMAEYTTKNRDVPVYFIDSTTDGFNDYIKKTLNTGATYPVTFIIKDGKVTATKEGAIQYYYFADFVDENYNAK